mmetsp:Transcript_17811/g.21628  ORF Transcript_17811/g.21628 Transcript_17811/m.21628 type:complete len:444 (+) Transcript_17811:226-1557(+)|eukprot:CAMPEP_0184011234 /NCGR_PEP_ID=MMETSP0954-20121128/3704_1 /TAXON_ID=627963 /ORGANISM="Aplanochytrium sp, Strain PBS07" /LENGTH=443 /DNA_ID=CAMNT_0026291009 /DNA_START=353 /DNA_END=1684 /DNA_ORIENTATION=-
MNSGGVAARIAALQKKQQDQFKKQDEKFSAATPTGSNKVKERIAALKKAQSEKLLPKGNTIDVGVKHKSMTSIKAPVTNAQSNLSQYKSEESVIKSAAKESVVEDETKTVTANNKEEKSNVGVEKHHTGVEPKEGLNTDAAKKGLKTKSERERLLEGVDFTSSRPAKVSSKSNSQSTIVSGTTTAATSSISDRIKELGIGKTGKPSTQEAKDVILPSIKKILPNPATVSSRTVDPCSEGDSDASTIKKSTGTAIKSPEKKAIGSKIKSLSSRMQIPIPLPGMGMPPSLAKKQSLNKLDDCCAKESREIKHLSLARPTMKRRQRRKPRTIRNVARIHENVGVKEPECTGAKEEGTVTEPSNESKEASDSPQEVKEVDPLSENQEDGIVDESVASDNNTGDEILEQDSGENECEAPSENKSDASPELEERKEKPEPTNDQDLPQE